VPRRRSLVQLIEAIAANGRAADIKVLKYGVTRDRLRDVLQEAEGWDIIHVSGHGTPGPLVLETAAGAPDQIDAADLADLLDLARDRAKFVTVAACWSAALTANEQRRLLRLPILEDQRHVASERPEQSPLAPGPLRPSRRTNLPPRLRRPRHVLPGGRRLRDRPVRKLYALLADKGQPLPRAVAMTLQGLGRGDRHGRAFQTASTSMTPLC
jgi:hypothetical protein